MLLIHKPRNHKLLILVITSICNIGALLGLSVLTYTPELSHAEQVTYPSLSNITYMQDMNADICKHSHENETRQLIDSRDGKTYWVTKLKDGNCWMTQNLDLDLYANGANRKLTSADSDVISDWTSTTGASGLWNGSSSDYNVVKYYDPGEYAYTKPTNWLDSGCGLLNSDTCKNAGWELMSGANSDKSGNEMAHYLVGNYYSWGAATAGQATSISAAGESTQSICPKGWQLPINSGDKSYNTLLTSYGTNSGPLYGTQDIRLSPLYFVYGGFVNSSSLLYAGSYGYYWSSTADNASNAYALLFDTSVNPSLDRFRYLGSSVRCIARTDPPETLSNLTYMQDMTMDVCKNSDIEETKQLIDKRDNKTYWVAKLKDGNCWMTQNLDYNGGGGGYNPDNLPVGIKYWFYDPGAYVFKDPSNLQYCDAYLPNCIDYGWVYVGDKLASSDQDFYEVNRVAIVGNAYDAHYLIGNYYSWYSTDQDICPAGWKIPSSGNDGQFGRLLAGLSSSGSADEIKQNDIKMPPYYFLPGGNYRSGAGWDGRYWTSDGNDDYAYYLYFRNAINVAGVNSFSGNQQHGLSVRCMYTSGNDHSNIEIVVNPTISLDVANEVKVEKTETNPSTANLDVKVSSNQKYSVGISATNPNLTSLTNNTTIPAKSGLLNTAENGWGIKKYGIAGIEESNYTAITKDLQTFYTASGAEIKTIPFTIGISTAPDLPNGEYSTDITITATQN